MVSTDVSLGLSLPPALQGTCDTLAKFPLPINQGLAPFPAALSLISATVKNLAYFQATYQVIKANGINLRPNLVALAGAIAVDILNIGLHLGESLYDKAMILGESLLFDGGRVAAIAAPGQLFVPEPGAIQSILAYAQLAHQQEMTFNYFLDTPAKTGNLYRAIEANNAWLVDQWSKNPSFNINRMGEGGISQSIPALFIAAQVPNVDAAVFEALLKNGANPESSFLFIGEENAVRYSLTEYLEKNLPDRLDLMTLVSRAIEDKKLKEAVDSGQLGLGITNVPENKKGGQQMTSLPDPVDKEDEEEADPTVTSTGSGSPATPAAPISGNDGNKVGGSPTPPKNEL